MPYAVDTPKQRDQKYKLRDRITVFTKPPSGENQVFEAGELFWWNCEHFVAVEDGAKISRSMLRKLKNHMIPVDSSGKEIDQS